MVERAFEGLNSRYFLMTSQRLKDLLERFRTNTPASAEEIHAFEKGASMSLPVEYRDFLRISDGGEGFVGPAGYAMLWKVSELLPFNHEYEAAEYAPGLLLFGSNGGGEAFAFDLRFPDKPIVSVPFIGMDLTEALPVAKTFEGFLEYLARQ